MQQHVATTVGEQQAGRQAVKTVRQAGDAASCGLGVRVCSVQCSAGVSCSSLCLALAVCLSHIILHSCGERVQRAAMTAVCHPIPNVTPHAVA
jgi:hypothetical protein